MWGILKHRPDDSLLEEAHSGLEFKLMDFEIRFYLFWVLTVTQRRLAHCLRMTIGN